MEDGRYNQIPNTTIISLWRHGNISATLHCDFVNIDGTSYEVNVKLLYLFSRLLCCHTVTTLRSHSLSNLLKVWYFWIRSCDKILSEPDPACFSLYKDTDSQSGRVTRFYQNPARPYRKLLNGFYNICMILRLVNDISECILKYYAFVILFVFESTICDKQKSPNKLR